MKQIPLTKGAFALVDDEDYEFLSQWKWHVTNSGYAARIYGPRGGQVMVYMHKLIMGQPKFEGDHINRNKLDNQKKNLRGCTSLQNKGNTKIRCDNKTGYKGVFQLNKSTYLASIRINGRSKYIGRFKNPEDAATAYNFYAVEHFGEFANLNVA